MFYNPDFTVLLVKKSKRGEAYLFNEATGQLTDEAVSVCKICGLDNKELYKRYVLFDLIIFAFHYLSFHFNLI